MVVALTESLGYGATPSAGSNYQSLANPEHINDALTDALFTYEATVKGSGTWWRTLAIDFGASARIDTVTYVGGGDGKHASIWWPVVRVDGVAIPGAWTDHDTDDWDIGVGAGDTWRPTGSSPIGTVLTLYYERVLSGLLYIGGVRGYEVLVNGELVPAPPPAIGVYADWDGDGFGDPASDDDLTGDTASWVITRGASPEITGGATPGSAVITLVNRADDRYNPWHADGALAGHLVDGVPVWIGVNNDGLLVGDNPRGLFAGRITDITPVPGPGTSVAPFVELSCEDALGWYGRTPVRLDYAEGRSQNAYRWALLVAAGETLVDLANEIATIPLSSADGDLLPLLEEINRANGTRHWCHPADIRDTWYAYTTRNRQHGLDGVGDGSVNVRDDHVTQSSGWRLSGDTVINRQKAAVVPVTFTLGAVKVWEASELPIEVTTAKPFEVFVDFDDYVDASTLEIASTGSAITSALTSFGVRGKITMTVASGTGTVSALNVWGRLARRAPEEAHIANDATSQAMSRGIRSGSDISGDVVGTLASARGIAEHVVWRYGNPQMRPTITVENWFPEQFTLDLYDILALTSPQLGITDVLFEIVGLTHEARLAASAAAVHHLTTYVLQECKVQTPTDWFILDSSLLDSTDMLAY